MDTIKSLALDPLTLPSGALLHPGRTAEVNDLEHPTIAQAIDDGQLAVVVDDKPRRRGKRQAPSED